jgi:transposase InsO family protein
MERDLLKNPSRITKGRARGSNCWDNAPMETFFGCLKEEVLRHVRKPSFEEACQIIDDYIDFYNY